MIDRLVIASLIAGILTILLALHARADIWQSCEVLAAFCYDRPQHRDCFMKTPSYSCTRCTCHVFNDGRRSCAYVCEISAPDITFDEPESCIQPMREACD